MDAKAGKIVQLRTNDGETFDQSIYEIQPFSQSSFLVRVHKDSKRFLILPTRVVDRIWMEEADDAGDKVKS